MSKKLFIETMGCAMNTLDSEHMISELREKEGYELTTLANEADLILINTCSVREKPERKLFSEIGAFAKIKKAEAKIGVCGCTASHLGEEILKRAPSVSFVLGARNTSRIAEIVSKKRAVLTNIDFDDSNYIFSKSNSKYKRMINISIGCDKSCSYCIVPFTRGEEISVPLDLILSQAKIAAFDGAKEIVLLGQNVNNYGRRFSTKHKKIDFRGLLQEISQIDGVERIRFTSPHPLHMDDEFIDEFITNKKICKSIHMPLQSGSSRILKLMKRGYTKEWFLDRVDRIRSRDQKIAIGSDIIVAFPTESESDFLDSLDVLERVRFDQLFSFKYSPRPHTEALNLKESVEESVAQNRLERLQKRHKEILDELALREVGEIFSVYFEEFRDGINIGRSDSNKLVEVRSQKNLSGEILDIKIVESSRVKLFGEVVSKS